MATSMTTILFACLSLATIALAQDDLECSVRKQANKKFYGNVISSQYLDTEIECANACYQYRPSDIFKRCRAVNYQESIGRCEMLADTAMFPDKNSGSLESFPRVSYIEVIYCFGSVVVDPTISPTEAPEEPEETETEAPKPPKNVTIPAGTCGQTSVPNKINRSLLNRRSPLHRIVGGLEARPHSMPYIVSLRTPRTNFHFCGGTLIRVGNKDESDIVVTAAHCMEDTKSVKIVAGAHYLSNEADGEVGMMGAEVAIHPNYNYPVATNNDIAIIRLSKPIKFSDTIQPACLPTPKSQPADGANLLVSGWGVTRENGISPEALQQVVVPVVNPAKCMSLYGRGQIVAETMLCAGFDQGMKDACQGDSGGPLVSMGPTGYTLEGVVSFGNGCARARAPGIYTRVPNYIDWIQKQITSMSKVN